MSEVSELKSTDSQSILIDLITTSLLTINVKGCGLVQNLYPESESPDASGPSLGVAAMEGHFPFILTACGAAISLVLGIWSSLRNGVKPMTLSGTVVCTFLFLILIYGQNNNDQLANLVARSFIFYFVFTFVLFVLAFHPYYFLKGFFFTSYLNGIPIAVHQLVQFIAVMSVSLNRIYQLQSLIPPLQVFVVLLFVYIYPLGTIEAFSTIDFMTRKQIKLECGKNEEKISYQISLVVFLVVLAVMLLFPFNWLMYNIAVLAYAVLLLKYCFFHHTILCLSLVTLISLIDAVVFPVHEVGIAPVGLITCPEILFTTDCVTAFRMEYLFVPGLLISCICHYEKYRVPDRLKILPSENSEIRVGIPENEEELVQERQKIILIAASIGYILSSFAAHYFSFLSKYTLLTLTLGTSLLPLIVLMLLYWPKGELLRFIATHSHQEIIDQLSYAFQKTKGKNRSMA